MIVKPSLSEDESPEILHVIKAGEFVECGKSSSFHPRLNPLQHASMLLIDAVAKQLVFFLPFIELFKSDFLSLSLSHRLKMN